MKGISKIEIKHYKGLYGTYNLELGENCKNLLLYGENGSGKSSICDALKLFFEASSDSAKVFKPNEHKFLDVPEKDTGYIQLTFIKDDDTEDAPELLNCDNSSRPTQSFIKETNKLKAFLGYKSLLETHYVKSDNVNVFTLLVENILYFFPNAFNKKILGKEWEELLALFEDYKTDKKRFLVSLNKAISKFNDGVENALSEITTGANDLIKIFNYNIDIHFKFDGIELDTKEPALNGDEILLKVNYHGSKNLPRHHYFLNEARLTAIGISIFLAAVLKIPKKDKYKILVLDDIFVGLDTANRIPLLKIFEDFFSEYQIVMATYDRHWYSVAKKWLSTRPKEWKAYELYLDNETYKYGKPELIEASSPMAKAIKHYRSPKPDYPAAANYLRKAAENALKDFLPDHFMKNGEGLNYVNLNDFILRAVDFCKVMEYDYDNFVKLQQYKDMLLNPMSHYNIDYPVYKSDVLASKKLIQWMENLLKSNSYEIRKLFGIKTRIRIVVEIDDGGGLISKFAYLGETTSEFFFIKRTVNREYRGKIKLAQVTDLKDPTKPVSFNQEMYCEKLLKSIFEYLKSIGKTVNKYYYEYLDGATWKDLATVPDDYWDKKIEARIATP